VSKPSLSPGIAKRVGGPQAHDQTHLDATRRTAGEARFWGNDLSRLARAWADLHDQAAQGMGRDRAAGMPKAEVPEFHEVFRENVLQEPAEKLPSIERGRSWASPARLPGGAGDGAVLERVMFQTCTF
jgi:hypothetical protein